MNRTRFRAAAILAIAFAIAGASTLARSLHGLSLVIRGADLHGVPRDLAELDTVAIRERLVDVKLRHETIRARVYAPVSKARHTALLVSGLHPGGIDEPRLIALAREFSKSGVTLVTPDLPGLSQLEIAPALTDYIEQVAIWLADDRELSPGGRIGLVGISFSGGLAIVAAGRVSLRDRLLYVLSLGGHDDLRRVLTYFCAGSAEAHDYGLAIVLLNIADRLVPLEQVEALRSGVRRFLWASYLDRVDKKLARSEFAAVRELARRLPNPAAELLDYVNNRDVAHLGPLLLPKLAFCLDDPRLSPARSPAPSVPVFLLHGTGDTVIPATESQQLARRLGSTVRVHLLLTDLITHADADQPAHPLDVLGLARFWGKLLSASPPTSHHWTRIVK